MADVFDIWGIIPGFLAEGDPRPAKEQLAEHYSGGWHPLAGAVVDWTERVPVLRYPGDQPYRLLSVMMFRDEILMMFEHSLLAIVQQDRSHEVSRVD